MFCLRLHPIVSLESLHRGQVSFVTWACVEICSDSKHVRVKLPLNWSKIVTWDRWCRKKVFAYTDSESSKNGYPWCWAWAEPWWGKLKKLTEKFLSAATASRVRFEGSGGELTDGGGGCTNQIRGGVAAQFGSHFTCGETWRSYGVTMQLKVWLTSVLLAV